MKSLEIVRDKLYILEKYPSKIETVKLEKDVLINQEQLLKIEQDLEVLEIIRKKEVDVNLLTALLEEELTLEEILYIINDECCKLTMEELIKLKQWLEVNENEN